jgi:hypothetical protein
VAIPESIPHEAITQPEAQALAAKLWFPRWFDDPPITEVSAIGTDVYQAYPADKRGEMIETVRKNRLAIEERGQQAFVDGDGLGFLCSAPSTHAMLMFERNWLPLLQRGIYDETLLHAITATRTNNRHVPLYVFRELVRRADRDKLRAVGDPLPGSGPFTLYRGVAGKTERDRRVRGISWTGTLATAAWFADRGWGLPNPEVYKTVLDAKHVLAYVGSHRDEDEYLVLLPSYVKVERVPLPLGTKEAA